MRLLLFSSHGAVAQLGERMNGIHEVVGSIPSSSTRDYKGLAEEASPFFILERGFVTFCDISDLTEVVSPLSI
jgi:hypothetical protein